MKFKFALLALLFLVFSCDEDEDVCEECQSAIDHMYGKLEENSCNPDYMQNAYQRIVEHCGVINANYVTGYMAHTCQHDHDNFFRALCEDVDGDQGFSKFRLDNVDISIDLLNTSNQPEDIQLIIRLEPETTQGSEAPSALLKSGQTASITYNDVEQDYNFLLTMIRAIDEGESEPEILLSSQQYFFFYRPGNWNNTRNISIGWDPIEQAYYANWNYW